MGKVRIIGGVHRSRLLPVLDAPNLRPTLDRVKETLFNWLNQDLTNAKCLDLFAGSGSLGFEAYSRNAKIVVLVEKEAKLVKQLQLNLGLLNAGDCCEVIAANALDFLVHTKLKFDVIFLDPPYNSDLLARSLALVSKVLASDGKIYIEYKTQPDLTGFKIIKHSRAGGLEYALLTVDRNL